MMRGMRRRGLRRDRVLALFVSAALGLGAGTARSQGAPPAAEPPRPDEPPAQVEPPAEPAPPPSAPPPEDPKLAEAKRLFYLGNELRKAGDCRHAIDYFKSSRELVPSVPNVLNGAICLARVGRADEALELYDQALAQFLGELSAEERSGIDAEMKRLQADVGVLDVVVNVPARLVIDGRARGEVPRKAPLALMPGRHVVRLVAEGHGLYEESVTIDAGKTTALQATLRPPPVAGRARIEDAGIEEAQVFVDGAMIGNAPWEGALAPGTHYYYVQKGDIGSAPARLVVVTGQTVAVTPRVLPLGPELRIGAEPATAAITIGGVAVGAGSWQGRLPVGSHAIAASEPGYFDRKRELRVPEDAASNVVLVLEMDPDHPRWAVAESGHPFLEALVAFAVTPSLGSAAEASCDVYTCSADGAALGAIAGLRGGYELPFRLSLELGAGFLRVAKSLQRTVDESFIYGNGNRVATTYELEDALRITGGFVTGGLGYRAPIADPVELRLRLHVGALFSSAHDTVTGTASAGTERADVAVAGSGSSGVAPDLLFLPEVHLGVRLGAFALSAGLTVAILALPAPDSELGDITVAGNCDPSASPGSVACAPGEASVAGERAYGPMVIWSPGVSAGYWF
jgi:PEGA domain-containing protein